MAFDLWADERARADVLECGVRVLRRCVLGSPAAALWYPHGKRPRWDRRFRTEQEREDAIAREIESYKARRAEVSRRRTTENVGDLTQLDAGTVLVYSWGYDQTNVDYFQVVKRSGTTVEIAPIAREILPESQGYLCERVQPRKDAFILRCRLCDLTADAARHQESCGAFEHHFDGYLPTQRKRIRFFGDKACLSMDHGIASIVPIATFGDAPPLAAQSHYASHYA